MTVRVEGPYKARISAINILIVPSRQKPRADRVTAAENPSAEGTKRNRLPQERAYYQGGADVLSRRNDRNI